MSEPHKVSDPLGVQEIAKLIRDNEDMRDALFEIAHWPDRGSVEGYRYGQDNIKRYARNFIEENKDKVRDR